MKDLKLITSSIILLLIVLISGCKEDDPVPPGDQPNPTSFTDTRDGTVYALVEIGSQLWFAENLNYNTGNSVCFDLEDTKCDTFGRMYDWNTALTACPDGWRLPSKAEWETLINELGGEAVAGGKLKTKGLAHWDAPNTGATNESGFSALPAGYRTSGGSFKGLGEETNWWTSTEESMTEAANMYIYYDEIDVYWSNPLKTDMYSCRCIQE